MKPSFMQGVEPNELNELGFQPFQHPAQEPPGSCRIQSGELFKKPLRVSVSVSLGATAVVTIEGGR